MKTEMCPPSSFYQNFTICKLRILGISELVQSTTLGIILVTNITRLCMVAPVVYLEKLIKTGTDGPSCFIQICGSSSHSVRWHSVSLGPCPQYSTAQWPLVGWRSLQVVFFIIQAIYISMQFSLPRKGANNSLYTSCLDCRSCWVLWRSDTDTVTMMNNQV